MTNICKLDLKGKHFNAKVKAGDSIKKGDLLLEFDINAIKKAGYDVITPVIITNTGDYSDIIGSEKVGLEVKEREQLITLVK